MRIMTGDSQGGLSLQRQRGETQTRRLGAEHPTTLSERGNLASMLIDSGKPEQALPVALSVVEATTRVLGADSPRALRAKLNLSSLRSEERRVGNEVVSTCSSRWSPYH